MKAVFKREFKAYLSNPLGYIILAVYYFFLGMYFSVVFSYGSPSMPTVFETMIVVIVITVPVITMRLLSEDRRQKVDQVLFTAPVKLSSIVLGKFFAALSLYALAFAPTVIYEIIFMSYVGFKPVAYLYSLFGIILLGGALISIGMFVSSLTESVIISAVITLIINIVVLYLNSFAQMLDVDWVEKFSEKAAFIDRFQNFTQQLFSVPDIIYFLSIIAGFLFLSVRSLEKRRWY